MNRAYLAICLYLVTCLVQAQIYQWNDSKGVAHFSDEPQIGAQSIKLQPTQYYHSHAVKLTHKKPSVAPKANYIQIVQPKDKATIRNPQGSLTVIVAIAPDLKKEQKLQVLLDGVLFTPPQTTTQFRLNNINRGAHTIAIQQLNSDGKSILTTKPITIYMMPPKVTKLHMSP